MEPLAPGVVAPLPMAPDDAPESIELVPLPLMPELPVAAPDDEPAPLLLPDIGELVVSLLLAGDIVLLSPGERDDIEPQAASAITHASEIIHLVIKTPEKGKSCRKGSNE